MGGVLSSVLVLLVVVAVALAVRPSATSRRPEPARRSAVDAMRGRRRRRRRTARPADRAGIDDLVDLLDEIYASKDYAEWCRIMQAAKGVWAPMQTPLEVHDDPQTLANGHLADVEMANGTNLKLVTSPVQFDEQPAKPLRAPELGEHTETFLLDMGLSWDEISSLKDSGAIG